MRTTFLYQMGRVGSNSINHTLYNSGINAFHAHWLAGNFPESEFPTTKPKIVKQLQKGETQPLKIITPIREPMARNLSAFMFNLINYGVTGRKESPEELRDLFLKEYNINYPDLWFEKEFIPNIKLNPFEKRFSTRKGYQIYKVNKNKILILRLEDANKVFPTAIRRLLGVRNLQLIHIRSLENAKYIGEKYKQLKALPFPKDFLEKVYNLKYVKHFYTEKEISTFIDKWRGT